MANNSLVITCHFGVLVLVSRPLVYLTLAFAAGIFLAGSWELSPNTALLICGALFFAAVLGYFFHWSFNRWVILSLFLALGLARATLDASSINPALYQYTGHWVTVEGIVTQEADVRSDRVYYWLDVHRISLGREARELQALVLVRAAAPGPVYSYGDRLRLHGLLTRPPDAGNPGEFDYRAYLTRRGAGAVLMVRDPASIQKLGVGGHPVVRAVLRVKEKLLTVSRATLPPDKAALLNGIVFGSQGQIDRKTWQLFSESGVVHILSVSGLHVGLVLAGVLALVRLLRVPLSLTAPTGTAILLLYATLCGLGPAVTRSTLMALMFLWAHHLGRTRDWPTTLAAAALVSLMAKPLSLYDIGFQLSFTATWGILYLGPVLDGLLKNVIRHTWLRAALWVSLAAQLATLPLIAWYYNLISLVSLLTNLAAVPLTGLILALGTASALLGLVVSSLAGFINISTSMLLDLFMGLVSFCRALPGSVIYVPTPPFFLVVAWYPLLFLGVLLVSNEGRAALRQFFSRHHRLLPVAFMGGGLLIAIFLFKSPGESQLVVHFIDVGQGDSILVQTPGGRNMLVDTGGWPGELDSGEGAGEKVVVPYLRRLGVRRLDVLVITHPHEDHAGGMRAVIEAFPVDLVLVSPVGGTGDPSVSAGAHSPSSGKVPLTYRTLLAGLAARGVPVKATGAGDRLHLDPALDIQVLGPSRPLLSGTRSDLNNASVVLRLRYGEEVLLLTGDIEVEAQQALMDGGVNLGCTVLKIPHHGSRYLLPSFLEKTHPAVAVISVGRHNNFGHPAPETLEHLARMPVRVYRTDLDGAVILRTDGKHIFVRTGRQRRAA
ncbi:DNA internalization-related competence protein ComEC/Rec2 [Desulfofundulus kuznetsovii DSM 6115]|uniref:DNA internalization-related competence protein ComEC/Rec2 n=1 Tax=Desulfofundulus kuznetsovii (strain DSM 6115 / VKM B-1805 / 17) TaxID=760568 RepID=A0AAU8PJS5_DESK7|nr:DNA internalization-related competence protein ComEC/Rec2 [Desulfofundulus kuznetsovii DSM 6115]